MSFLIHIEGDFTLSKAEVWPDGDAPKHPTADDVKAVMEAHGPKWRTLRDWELDDLTVTIDHGQEMTVEVWE